MKKTTQNNFSKRLLKYTALTAAIAGVADANGQIEYTDIDPDGGGFNTVYDLDLNNDATVDFSIFTGGAGGANPINAVAVSAPTASNSFLGSIPSYVYPFALDADAVISAGGSLWIDASSNIGTLNYVSCYSSAGGSNWCGVVDKYLGLRFKIGADTHYGWARLDVEFSGMNWTIKDYAYNTTPDEAINAGQTSLSLEDFDQAHNYVISFIDKQVTIGSIVDRANYRIISISGQIVMKGSSNSESEVIDLSNLSSGIYIVEVTDGNEQRIQRKKIVLN